VTPANPTPTVTFDQAVVTVFRKYADFTGRAGRAEFWWFTLFSTLVSMALSSLDAIIPDGSVRLGTSLASMWGIAVLLPSLAVAVRRLRDAGRSWTQLFWILLPIAGLIILIVRFCEPSRPTTEGASS
jgi:uncharacterized membrane protein YhaH (DUF805 family)